MPLSARLSGLLRRRPLRIWPRHLLPTPHPKTTPPPANAAEPPLERAVLLADAVAQCLVIDYRDLRGKESRHRITVRRIWAERDGGLAIEAFCHERQATQCFRTARIQAVTDPVNGAVFDDAAWFLRRHLGAVPGPVLREDHTAQALARCRAELALLVCLAPSDGRTTNPAELAPLLIHVARRCADLSYNKERVLAYIRRLCPDEDALHRALTQLPAMLERDLRRVLSTAAELCGADGVDPGDRPLLEELRRAAAGCRRATP